MYHIQSTPQGPRRGPARGTRAGFLRVRRRRRERRALRGEEEARRLSLPASPGRVGPGGCGRRSAWKREKAGPRLRPRGQRRDRGRAEAPGPRAPGSGCIQVPVPQRLGLFPGPRGLPRHRHPQTLYFEQKNPTVHQIKQQQPRCDSKDAFLILNTTKRAAATPSASAQPRRRTRRPSPRRGEGEAGGVWESQRVSPLACLPALTSLRFLTRPLLL